MRLIRNFIWLISGGLPAAIAYFILGIILCFLVITIPWGMMAVKLGFQVLLPFDKKIVQRRSTAGCHTQFESVIWLFCAGWILALMHLLIGLLLCLTIVGIFFGLHHIRLIFVALDPFSYELKFVPEGSLPEVISDKEKPSRPIPPKQKKELHQRESSHSTGRVVSIRELLGQSQTVAKQVLTKGKEKGKKSKREHPEQQQPN